MNMTLRDALILEMDRPIPPITAEQTRVVTDLVHSRLDADAADEVLAALGLPTGGAR